MIEVPFIYIVLQAFSQVLRFDGRKYIEVKDIYKYSDKILEGVLDDYYNNTNPFYRKNDVWQGEIQFKEFDKEDELNKVLAQNPDIFYLENSKIYLNSYIGEDEVLEMIKSYNMPRYRFNNANDSKEILKLLNINKIYESMKKYEKYGYELEKEIEQAYKNNVSEEKIRLLLYKRFLFVFNVGVSDRKFIENYNRIPSDTISIPIDENYDYYINSIYIMKKEPYPIDKHLYEKSEFYESVLEELNSIQSNIEDVYQYAIFGREHLYDWKYDKIFDEIYTHILFGPKEQVIEDALEDFFCIDSTDSETHDLDPNGNYAMINFDIEDEEFAFYIIYIKKLNDLIEQGRKEFINIRNRLLYLLDDIKYCLFKKENFDKFYIESINYEKDEDSFDFFANESKYFIEEVFEGKAGKNIEKLLFTSVYYELTGDEEIKEILSRYENYENYEEYSRIVLGKNKGYSKIKNM